VPVADDSRAAIAEKILAAGDTASSIPPITDELADFGLPDAYAVSAMVTRLRAARGERPVGWKIGFTNQTIWDEYGVHAPIWGPMYSSTVAEGDPAHNPVRCPIGNLVEPRIEPEIALRVAAVPHAGMDERELMSCVDGVAHGFEIVQSIFPGWKFKAADTVAAFALHGCYRHGPFIRIGADDRDQWRNLLAAFEIELFRNGNSIDKGVAENVLGGGPLSALRYLVRGLAEHPNDYGLRPGDIVTTGTVTRAFPVQPGERWSTRLTGLRLPGMSIVFE
jgi:2-oxo-3-hexenedioate decarboxylase